MQWRYFLAFFLLIAFSIISEFDAHASYCTKKTHVFFGNGMFNDQEMAQLSSDCLKDRFIQSGALDQDQWNFDVSYNHDEKLFSIFQVFRQREGERTAKFWGWISGLSIAPEWFRTLAIDLATRGDLQAAVSDADLRRHIQNYKRVIMEGGRVLVVGHSQGNLYANAAHTNLANDPDRIAMNAFGLVAVATPSGRVADGGPHITRTDDLVINSVRLFYPDTLPGNVSNTANGSDWKHHNFVDSYLDGDVSGPLIVDRVFAVADSLAWPEPRMGSGPLTVTMNWGGQPDVDLHIYEPSGQHVYYASPHGTSGYLDYDDVSGYGPEHYYVVSCDRLETGLYRVGLNYYQGSGPETAHVMIQAGEVVKDYTVSLPAAEGRAGDSNPEPVATISVEGDPVNGYRFVVAGGG